MYIYFYVQTQICVCVGGVPEGNLLACLLSPGGNLRDSMAV